MHVCKHSKLHQTSSFSISDTTYTIVSEIKAPPIKLFMLNVSDQWSETEAYVTQILNTPKIS